MTAAHLTLGVSVMCLCAAIDILYCVWTSAVHSNRHWVAAATSASIQLVGIGMVLMIIGDRWLLIPNVLGHALGSYIGVRWRL